MITKLILEFNKDDDLRYRYKMAYSISRSYHTIVSFNYDNFLFSVDKNMTYSNLEEIYNNYKSMKSNSENTDGFSVEVVKDNE